MGQTHAVLNWRLAVVFAGLQLCSACAGRSDSPLIAPGAFANSQPQSAVDLQEQSAAAPGLPPLPLGRIINKLTESVLSGSAYWQSSSGAQVIGADLLLEDGQSAAAAGDTPAEYAIYHFNSANQLDSIMVSMESSGSGAYIGLSNYALGRWEFSGPYSTDKTLPLNSGSGGSSPYVSPGDDIYAVLVPAPAASVTIHSLSVRAMAPGNQVPWPAISANPVSGNAPLTVIFSGAGSTDSDGTIVEYAWDWDGNGGYEEVTEQVQINHTFTQPGQYDVILRVSDELFGHGFIVKTIDVFAAGNAPPVAALAPPAATGSTPLTLNFDASGSTAGGDPGDSIVLYEWDFDGNGLYDTYGPQSLAQHTYSSYGIFTTSVRVTDSAGNQDSADCVVTVNQSPSAVLRILPDEVSIGADVELDAGLSSDLDGSIVSYEWDTDADGSYETDSGVDSLITITTSRAGSLPIGLRVTDEDGGISTCSELLHVHGGTGFSGIIAGEGSGNGNEDISGLLPSLAIVNGRPAVVFHDSFNDAFYYVRAQDAAGEAWAAPVLLSGADSASTSASNLAVINGRPASCYEDQNTGKYRFVRASDADGNSWQAAVDCGDFGLAGDSAQSDCSLATIAGVPALAFSAVEADASPLFAELRYARALDADGLAWATSIQLDTRLPDDFANPACRSLTLLDAGGKPAVSYNMFAWWARDMRYIRALDAQGLAWGGPLVIDGAYTGLAPVMAPINGRPTVACVAEGWGVAVCRANDADGTTWGALNVFEDSAQSQYTTFAAIGAVPTIAFNGGSGFLYLLESQDADGTAWGELQLVDATKSWLPSLCQMPDGHPGIAYTDFNTQALRFAAWF